MLGQSERPEAGRGSIPSFLPCLAAPTLARPAGPLSALPSPPPPPLCLRWVVSALGTVHALVQACALVREWDGGKSRAQALPAQSHATRPILPPDDPRPRPPPPSTSLTAAALLRRRRARPRTPSTPAPQLHRHAVRRRRGARQVVAVVQQRVGDVLVALVVLAVRILRPPPEAGGGGMRSRDGGWAGAGRPGLGLAGAGGRALAATPTRRQPSARRSLRPHTTRPISAYPTHPTRVPRQAVLVRRRLGTVGRGRAAADAAAPIDGLQHVRGAGSAPAGAGQGLLGRGRGLAGHCVGGSVAQAEQFGLEITTARTTPP